MIYEEIETKVTELVGGEDTLLFPTITHIHMSVIPVLAGARHDLPRRTRAQDDLRRRDDRPRPRRDRPALPSRRPRASRRAAAVERDHASRHRDRRRQLDDSATRPICASSRGSPASTTRCSTSTTPTGSASSASARRTSSATGASAATASSATRARRYENVIFVAGFCKSYSSLLSFLDAADAAEGRPEGRGASLPVLGPLARSPRSRRRSSDWT